MDEKQKQDANKELATLGGGCFWCIEPIFKDLKGVEQAVVGYSGGTILNSYLSSGLYGNNWARRSGADHL